MMSIGKILKWFVAPQPDYSDPSTKKVSEDYGRKSPDRNWYKVDGAFAIKYSGEPEYAIVGESHYQSAISRIVGKKPTTEAFIGTS